jgi:SAM-dependent methyltransferase
MPVAPAELRVTPKEEKAYRRTAAEAMVDYSGAGLQPNHRFLDMGCGSGRMAVPLTLFLGERGSYFGLDILEDRIKWCQENITPVYPNFTFDVLPVHNDYYVKRESKSVEVPLPVEDKSIDFMVMSSVFSHLRPDECIHYLKEAGRVLKPTGRLWASWFLLNEEARGLIKEGKSHFNYHVGEGPDYYTSEKRSLIEVAYDPAFVEDAIRDAGLVHAREIWYGHWCGRGQGNSSSTNQDVLLLQPKG